MVFSLQIFRRKFRMHYVLRECYMPHLSLHDLNSVIRHGKEYKVEFSLCLIKNHPMKTCEGVEVMLFNSWPLYYIEVSCHLHAPGALTPVPIGEDAGWAPEPAWTAWSIEKSLAPAGNRIPVVQYVGCHYTDWAIRLWIASLCSSLQPPVTSPLLVPGVSFIYKHNFFAHLLYT
jgi:hypothetical protein